MPAGGLLMKFCNSSAQDFALAAKSVETCKLCQEGICPLAEGDLEWADSVTVKPKAELLRNFEKMFEEH